MYDIIKHDKPVNIQIPEFTTVSCFRVGIPWKKIVSREVILKWMLRKPHSVGTGNSFPRKIAA
jgi:hypothetical protein